MHHLSTKYYQSTKLRFGMIRSLLDIEKKVVGAAPLATIVTPGDCCPNKTQMAPIMQYLQSITKLA